MTRCIAITGKGRWIYTKVRNLLKITRLPKYKQIFINVENSIST